MEKKIQIMNYRFMVLAVSIFVLVKILIGCKDHINRGPDTLFILYIKALAIVLRTIAIAIAIEVKKSIEYCNMQ